MKKFHIDSNEFYYCYVEDSLYDELKEEWNSLIVTAKLLDYEIYYEYSNLYEIRVVFEKYDGDVNTPTVRRCYNLIFGLNNNQLLDYLFLVNRNFSEKDKYIEKIKWIKEVL